MILDTLIVLGICTFGTVMVAVFLRLIFGNNLTYQLWCTIIPGVVLLCTDVFLWTSFGGYKNITMSIILVPFGVGLMVANFIFMGKTVIGRINKVVDMFKDIAEGEGDLTKRIPVTSIDEIGQLAR